MVHFVVPEQVYNERAVSWEAADGVAWRTELRAHGHACRGFVGNPGRCDPRDASAATCWERRLLTVDPARS
jgi:hypothetical protein